MKSDINNLMKEKNIKTIFAMGTPHNDPTMFYLLNGVNVSGFYVKKVDEPGYLIHNTMEREEARKTGLKLIDLSEYEPHKIFNRYRDKLIANAFLIKRILDDFRIKGKVAFYGKGEIGSTYSLLRRLKVINNKIEIAYESDKSIITQARMTKGDDEIERIKRVRNGVVYAFEETLKMVQKMKIKGGIIYKENKKKLLIRDLKRMVKNRLFEKNLINSAGLIISQGRDAGIPHNSGKDNEAVRVGKTIIFDIYPQEIGGGYFFDFTRTVCFGFALKNIQEEFNIVKEAQDIAMKNLNVGTRTRDIEKAVCDFFEKKRHRTFLTNPKTKNGYCHSLGHGLGLNVHEGPTFGLLKTNQDRIECGMVFTIEPGLYYPEKGYGIRLEDVIYISKAGKIIDLTHCLKKLVVEM